MATPRTRKPSTAAASPVATRAPLTRVESTRVRVASAPVDAALGRTLSKAAVQLTDRALLTSTARGLVGGQLSLQSVLVSLVEAGGRALEAALQAAQRAAAQDTLTSTQLRQDLGRLKTNAAYPQPRKDDYAVTGQVMLASGEPAAGLVVEAVDADVSRDDTLGAAVTDEKGTFQITFRKKAFAESGEKEPEIVLVIGVEGRAPMLVTPPARPPAGERRMATSVTLPAGVSLPARAPAERLTAEVEARLLHVTHRQALVQLQHQQLSALATEAQSGLARLASALQPTSRQAATTPAPRGKRR